MLTTQAIRGLAPSLLLPLLLLLSSSSLSSCQTLTSTQAQLLVDLHNSIRSSVTPPAANMEGLYWDASLVSRATALVTSPSVCPTSPSPSLLSSSPGTNIAYVPQIGSVGTLQQAQISNAVQSWTSAGAFYDFDTNTCTAPGGCTPYLSLIYNDAWRMGCDISPQTCAGVPVAAADGTTTVGLGYAVACVYENVQSGGGVPYELGLPCSDCPANYPQCTVPLTCYAAGGTCPGLCAVSVFSQSPWPTPRRALRTGRWSTHRLSALTVCRYGDAERRTAARDGHPQQKSSLSPSSRPPAPLPFAPRSPSPSPLSSVVLSEAGLAGTIVGIILGAAIFFALIGYGYAVHQWRLQGLHGNVKPSYKYEPTSDRPVDPPSPAPSAPQPKDSAKEGTAAGPRKTFGISLAALRGKAGPTPGVAPAGTPEPLASPVSVGRVEVVGPISPKAAAALPPNWAVHTDGEGRSYYFNATNGASQWTKPTA